MRLLLIEDDIALASELGSLFRANGFVVDHAGNAMDGEHLGREESYDAIILDLGLPDRSGLMVLSSWRSDRIQTPVIILTARDTWEEKVDGLKRGADDYVTKPFRNEELLARLSALLRRSKQQSDVALGVEGFALDEQRQQIHFPDGLVEALTATEFRLLRYLLLHPDRLISKSELVDHVYAYDSDKDSNVIEVYMRRLRDKLGRDRQAWRIETRRGQGYLFRSESA